MAQDNNHNFILRPVISTPPVPDVFRMNPRSTQRVMHAPDKGPNRAGKPSNASRAEDVFHSYEALATRDEPSKVTNTTTSSAFATSSPIAAASTSWTDINIEPHTSISDLFTLESPSSASSKGTVVLQKRHSASRTSSNVDKESSFNGTSLFDISGSCNVEDLFAKSRPPSVAVESKSSSKAALPICNSVIDRPDRSSSLTADSPQLFKFLTEMNDFGDSKNPLTMVSAGVPAGPTSASMDPIMIALNHLQQDKSRLEHELVAANETVLSTKDEISSMKSLLGLLKEKVRKLSEIVTQIGTDRDQLRHAIDLYNVKIDDAKLTATELKSDVVVARREVESTRLLDLMQKLQALDKELYSKTLTCDVLQHNLDEKTGLLVEERSKVVSLEDNIKRLSTLNERLIEEHNRERQMGAQSVEEMVRTVQEGINRSWIKN
ncbi:hypothetical protein V1512DRAFT_41220 [Lipomyces arxii]|uniref:uncharacterized protein n=1 Tax=Lipomyces arxii TaxID=56418 RepID=UPI0034D00AC7